MAAQKDKKQQPSKGGAVELSEKDLNEVQGGYIQEVRDIGVPGVATAPRKMALDDSEK